LNLNEINETQHKANKILKLSQPLINRPSGPSQFPPPQIHLLSWLA
jgi:hypothetical protein